MNFGPDGVWYSIFWHHDCHVNASPPCEICKAVLAEHTDGDGKPLHGEQLLASKLAQIATPEQVHAAQLTTGPADPNSDLHDPAEAAKVPAAVQAVLAGPVAAPAAQTAAPAPVVAQ